MAAYKLVAAYSGVLNESAVMAVYEGNKYAAIDAVISATVQQFSQNADNISAGYAMIKKGKLDSKVLNRFTGRWEFMKELLTNLAQQNKEK